MSVMTNLHRRLWLIALWVITGQLMYRLRHKSEQTCI